MPSRAWTQTLNEVLLIFFLPQRAQRTAEESFFCHGFTQINTDRIYWGTAARTNTVTSFKLKATSFKGNSCKPQAESFKPKKK